MGRKATIYLIGKLGVVATAAMLALSTLSLYASHIAPQQGSVWVILAMILPLILIVNLCLLVFLLIRRCWIVALMPLAAILINIGYISTMVQLPKSAKQDEQGDLKIATLNVFGFRQSGDKGISAGRVNFVLRREGVDVACLQEFVDNKEYPAEQIIAEYADFLPYYHREASQLFLSRYPILNIQYEGFDDTNNSFLWADIDVNGRMVRIISAHLQTSGISGARSKYKKDYNRNMPISAMFNLVAENSTRRAHQADKIREVIARSPMPVILVGDFNDTPSTYTYYTLKGNDMSDGFTECGSGFGATYRYMKGFLRIDYILYNKYLSGVNYYSIDDELSDHLCVVADLKFADN